jgi:hypothetical protein
MWRVGQWIENYYKIAEKHKDFDGKMLKYSFFYPIEQYDKIIMNKIAELCRNGYGEVEVHLHHDNDNSFNLHKQLIEYKKRLTGEHGLLCVDIIRGEVAYGFIHGNWALDNSSPDGRWCGVNDEINVLRETGCYADFTMPSAPHPTQTRKINSIYFAIDDPEKPKSHDKGQDVCFGKRGQGLLMIQGPLGLNWLKRKYVIFPRIENGELSLNNPPTLERTSIWIRTMVHVQGRENWIFVKIHTHGAQESVIDMLFEKGELDRLFCNIDEYTRDRGYSLHYVSAREMANIVFAIEGAEDKYSISLRDYRLRRYSAMK